MSVADEIKSKLDIVQYIQRYVPLKKAGRTWKACCPFHSEKTPSFVVNENNQSWRCFGACAEGGDIFNFAMKYNGWTFTEALDELGKLAGVEVRQQTPEQRQHYEELDRLRGLLKSTADYFHDQLFDPNNPAAIATLNYARNKRGLSDDTLRRFQIGFAPPGWQNAVDLLTGLGYSEADLLATGIASRNEDSGRVYDRFPQPADDPDPRRARAGGRLRRAGARAGRQSEVSELAAVGAVRQEPSARSGWTWRNSRSATPSTAVIVEGYLDAIQAHQAGYTNVVAQMGTALTEAAVEAVSAAFSGSHYPVARLGRGGAERDPPFARSRARRRSQADYAGRLSVDIRVLVVPGAKDPDDLIRESPGQWAELGQGCAAGRRLRDRLGDGGAAGESVGAGARSGRSAFAADTFGVRERFI